MPWTPRQYEFTRKAIAARREVRRMREAGFHKIDPTNGQGFYLFDAIRQRARRIEEVKVNIAGDALWVRLAGD